MRYQKPKGQRVKRYGFGIQADGLWYDTSNKVWSETMPQCFSSHMRCNTIRAFRRALRKHPILKGRARWVTRFIGYDAFA
jgi:hypothetical protein